MIDKNKYIDNKLWDNLFKYAIKLTKNEDTAQELVQEIIYQYLTKTKDERIIDLQSRKDPTGAISAYLRGGLFFNYTDSRKTFFKMYRAKYGEINEKIMEIPDDISDYESKEKFEINYKKMESMLNEFQWFDRELFIFAKDFDWNISKIKEKTRISRARISESIRNTKEELQNRFKNSSDEE